MQPEKVLQYVTSSVLVALASKFRSSNKIKKIETLTEKSDAVSITLVINEIIIKKHSESDLDSNLKENGQRIFYVMKTVYSGQHKRFTLGIQNYDNN